MSSYDFFSSFLGVCAKYLNKFISFIYFTEPIDLLI